jgi:two-component system, chemotaxis family, sensor kinase CheA
MALDPEIQQKLLGIFRTDLGEQLQVITESLLVLETGPGDEARQEAIDPMMRAAHNLKGAARGIGVSTIGEITHHLETLFVELKKDNVQPSSEVIDFCLEVVDHLRSAMDAYDSGNEPPFDLPALTDKLQIIAREVSAGPTNKPAKQRKPKEKKAKPGSANKPASKVATAEPDKPVSAEALPPLDPVPSPAVADEADKAVLPVQSTDTSSESDPPATSGRPGTQDTVRVSIDRLEQVSALLEEMQVSRIEMDDHQAVVHQLRRDAEKSLLAWNDATHAPLSADQASVEEFRQHLENTALGFRDLGNSIAHIHQDIRSKINHLGVTLTSLQDEIRMMRLVPANSVLVGLNRSVRDISRELGKKVQFKLVGADTEMDQPILEKIRDPLLHLVRNAIDHGIEMPEERLASGKPESGTITLTITSEGTDIAIEIRDDGRGIDTARIARTAVKKNLVSEENISTLSETELKNLIFRPGFSTREIITEVSGRGVGMDVVRSNLQTIKGSVRVESVQGDGSAFILKVPLTLATERGLIVRTGGQMFAIPITAVENVMNLEANDVINVESGQAVMFDGQPTPLRHLSEALEISGLDPVIDKDIPVVVISAGWRYVAIVVEEVVVQQEMVIKPLKPPLVSVRNVSGGTLTGKGGVVIVLNANDLVESLLEEGRGSRKLQLSEAEEAPSIQVLVVDDTLTTRALEKNILEGEGYEVSVAVNGQEAWNIMQNQSFDLVVTDVQMPLMDGFELADNIKQSENHKHIPVIIVTSLASEDDKRRGIEVGADAYIVKSHFETRELVDIARQLT